MKKIRRKKKTSPSKGKVRNATPNTLDGIDFKSKLERYCYQKLKEVGIYAEYEGEKFEILPSFKYNGETIRKMTYTPDFVGKEFIIECKGFANDAFPLRWKIFKYHLFNINSKYDLYLLKSMKQIDEAIEIMKEKYECTTK